MYNSNMAEYPYQHTPVMVEEVLHYLSPEEGKTYVDCTLGGGGHAENIKLQTTNLPAGRHGCKIIGIDQDSDAIEYSKKRLSKFGDINFVHDNFANLKKHLSGKVDGFLFDLGVSSYQIDTGSRGFSFQKEGPLDMRMAQNQSLSAEVIINTFSIAELEKIFFEFGEERFGKRIARAIETKRKAAKLKTTTELKEIIEKAIPTWRKRESVARIFQALRIAVNCELEKLTGALADAVSLLNPGGRIVIISYHSLEDRIVKHLFREYAKDGILNSLTRKPVLASQVEIMENPRSRSAKLRAAEKR